MGVMGCLWGRGECGCVVEGEVGCWAERGSGRVVRLVLMGERLLICRVCLLCWVLIWTFGVGCDITICGLAC